MKTKGMTAGKVYYGDCLKNMQQWIEWNQFNAPVLADLIYADPPWNSNANYNVLFDKGMNALGGRTAQVTVFEDIWRWSEKAEQRVQLICGNPHPAQASMEAMRTLLGESGMLAYLSYMAERIALCHQLLKPTGSMYLHCDPYASHYLKMIMDDIFGKENFRNEIVWDYGKTSNAAAQKFLRGHDIILFYAKDKKLLAFHRLFESELSTRKKQLVDVGYNTKNMNGQRYLYIYDEAKVEDRVKQGKLKMEDFDIVRKVDTDKGNAITDVWEIDHLNSQAQENLGYPTQKPLKLLKRIVKASSNEDDLVLDPFCGCGTAGVAAVNLERQFVGIDVSLTSVETVVYNRLKEHGREFEVGGIPEDLASCRRLEKEDAFAFEAFAVERCFPGMQANHKQTADGGVDGHGRLLHSYKGNDYVFAQVKSSKDEKPPTVGKVRDFAMAMKMHDAVAGVFITMRRSDWSDGMQRVANAEGTFRYSDSAVEYPRLQHWSMEQYYENKKYNRFAHLPELSIPHSKEKRPFHAKQKMLWR